MRNQDEGIFILLEIAGEPLDVFRIQVVGRFVQEQDIRILQEQLGEEHLGPLAPGQFVHLVFQSEVPEPQASGHFFDPGIQIVIVRCFQPFLDFPHFLHEPVHFFRGSAFHFVVVRQHFLFLFHQVLESGPEGFPDGLPGLQGGMLVQVAHLGPPGPSHLPLIGAQFPRDDGHKGGFPFPVGPHQGDMFAFFQAERNIIENLPSPITVGQMGNIQNTHARTPSSFIRSSSVVWPF